MSCRVRGGRNRCYVVFVRSGDSGMLWRLMLVALDHADAEWIALAQLVAPDVLSSTGTARLIPVSPDGSIDLRLYDYAAYVYRAKAEDTADGYMRDLLVFLNFLATGFPETAWDAVTIRHVRAFLDFRLFGVGSTDGDWQPVSVGTAVRNRAALAAFYKWALDRCLVGGSPVPGLTSSSGSSQNWAKGGMRHAVKWVTRAEFRQWRECGVQGVDPSNAWAEPNLAMVERNVAGVDLAFATGMRLREFGSLLVEEVPVWSWADRRLAWGRVPCAKGSPEVGRIFYLDQSMVDALNHYVRGLRQDLVERGLEYGVYETVPGKIMCRNVTTVRGIANMVNVEGQRKGRHVSSIKAAERQRMYRRDAQGRVVPMALWLSQGGLPMKHTGWHDVFKAANARYARLFHCEPLGESLYERPDENEFGMWPHMLRHSFALALFAQAAQVALGERGNAVTPQSLRAVARWRDLDLMVWARVQMMLGHRHVSTTRWIYLEPVASMQWDLLGEALDDVPDGLDETLSRIAEERPELVRDRRVLPAETARR